MAADLSAYAPSMLQFLFGIAPVLVFLFVRLVLVLLKSWLTGKGGPQLITLNLPRLRGAKRAETHVVSPAIAAPSPRNSLCAACVYAHVVQGYEPFEVLIACGYAFPPQEVPFPVRECSDYKPKRKRSGVEIASEGLVSFPPLDN
jgi:hypothetical protein